MLEIIRDTIRKNPRKGKVSTYGEARAGGRLFLVAPRQVVWALRAGSARRPGIGVVGAGGKISLPGENGLEQRF